MSFFRVCIIEILVVTRALLIDFTNERQYPISDLLILFFVWIYYVSFVVDGPELIFPVFN